MPRPTHRYVLLTAEKLEAAREVISTFNPNTTKQTFYRCIDQVVGTEAGVEPLIIPVSSIELWDEFSAAKPKKARAHDTKEERKAIDLEIATRALNDRERFKYAMRLTLQKLGVAQVTIDQLIADIRAADFSTLNQFLETVCPAKS